MNRNSQYKNLQVGGKEKEPNKNLRSVWTSYVRVKYPKTGQTKSDFQSVYNAEPLPTKTMWQNKEPNNHHGRQNCGVSHHEGLDDDFCDSSHMVVCEYQNS